MITFYELMYIVTKPVNFDYNLEQEDRNKFNKRKMIRNRLHLWLFLRKNTYLIKYRKHNLARNSLWHSSDTDKHDDNNYAYSASNKNINKDKLYEESKNKSRFFE